MKTKYLSIIASALLVSSCVDTVILPDDLTVDEDFWKSKENVALMVNAAYKSMLNEDLITRLTMWGDLRSDEVTPMDVTTTNINTGMMEINTANIQSTNIYADWATLYSVINNCNIVLKKAPGVMDEDPYYTQGDLNVDRAQMLALRSLCYFYLVRNFRDVPYSTDAFMMSSQDMNLPQTPPTVVLDGCIKDLQEAETIALDADTYTGWKRTGWINKDAVRALLADIYLWRASVLHSNADYQACIANCDKVINARKAAYHPRRFETTPMNYSATDLTANWYPIAWGGEAWSTIFIDQNSPESIFELQFDGSKNSNAGIAKCYLKWKDNNSPNGLLKASSIFGGASATSVYEKTSDYRYVANVYDYKNTNTNGGYDIRKYTEQMGGNISDPTQHAGFKRTDRNQGGYKQNYIVYRLTDLMLMKAEAMVAQCPDSVANMSHNDSVSLQSAFNIVQYVNARSIYDSKLASDSLKWKDYSKGKAVMEELVLKERLRELCFEGKRWYDLLRFNYRHGTGVRYDVILADQGDSYMPVYSDMLQLMARKGGSGSAALQSKMRTEPYLYMPVIQSQIECNPNLKQNPVYSAGDLWEKNL